MKLLSLVRGDEKQRQRTLVNHTLDKTPQYHLDGAYFDLCQVFPYLERTAHRLPDEEHRHIHFSCYHYYADC